MRYVTKVKTDDGMLHDSSNEAMRHLDRVYGDKLSAIVVRIINSTDCKYLALHEFIDSNLPLFVELQSIKHDMELPRDEADD